MISIKILKKLILNPKIEYISFSIFGTLLQRPSWVPSDLFILLNKDVKNIVKNKSFNFYKIRKSIEKKIGESQTITFEEIYNLFEIATKVNKVQRNKIEKLELKIEEDLLQPRILGQKLYKLAVKTGKKIILIDDSYHDFAFLNQILIKNGYQKNHAMYLSSKTRKSKKNGDLFDFVIQQEGINRGNILHIGDSKKYDFEIPLEKSIAAIHLPNSHELMTASNTDYKLLWEDIDKYTPMERIIIGFYSNLWSENLCNTESFFPNKTDLGFFGLGPILLAISLSVLNNQNIQSRYHSIFFNAKNGYLLQKAYNLLREAIPKSLEADSIYADENSYNITSLYKKGVLSQIKCNLRKYSETRKTKFGPVINGQFNIELINKESKEFSEDFTTNISKKKIKKTIHNNNNYIKKIVEKRVKILIEYYHNKLFRDRKKRAIVFDCYHHIPYIVKNLVKKEIDQIIIWNIKKYKPYKFFVLKKSKSHSYFEFESFLPKLFFPPKENNLNLKQKTGELGVCNQQVMPSIEKDLEEIQEAALSFINTFKQLFGKKYVNLFILENISFAFEPFLKCLESKDDLSIRHLENICFSNQFFNEKQSLAYIIEKKSQHLVYRSEFLNSKRFYNIPSSNDKTQDLKIAIHIHLYYVDLSEEILEYLFYIEEEFDLLISVVSENNKRIVENFFNLSVLPKLKNIIIKVVPNRGRDVAPWLIAFREEHKKYDAVCHIHSKKSFTIDWGENWRKYLFENTISKQAVNDIVKIFKKDEKIGLVFPPFFDTVFYDLLSRQEDLLEVENLESITYQNFLDKIKIPLYSHKTNTFYPSGTMLWYRPKALKALFDSELTFEDFPKEPIGRKGTIAHKIERLLVLIANYYNYEASYYLTPDYLHKKFFETYKEKRDQFYKINKKPIKKKFKIMSRKLINFLFPGDSKRRSIIRKVLRRL